MNYSHSYSTDRLRGLLALAAKPVPKRTACPPDIELFAFMQGRLSRAAEDQLLQHFHACPACYRKWQDTASYVAVNRPPHPFWTWPRWLLQTTMQALTKFWKRFQAHRPSWQLAWVAAPALALLLVWHLLLTPTVPPLTSPVPLLQQQMNDSLRLVLAKTPQPLALSEWPWEASRGGYGFSAPGALPLALQALQTGLNLGKQNLLDQQFTPLPADSPFATEWQDYATLGQWTVLLWVVSETKPSLPDTFWQLQREMATTLQNRFRTRLPADEYAPLMLTQLERITAVLVSSDPPNYVTLKSALKGVMEMVIN